MFPPTPQATLVSALHLPTIHGSGTVLGRPPVGIWLVPHWWGKWVTGLSGWDELDIDPI